MASPLPAPAASPNGSHEHSRLLPISLGIQNSSSSPLLGMRPAAKQETEAAALLARKKRLETLFWGVAQIVGLAIAVLFGVFTVLAFYAAETALSQALIANKLAVLALCADNPQQQQQFGAIPAADQIAMNAAVLGASDICGGILSAALDSDLSSIAAALFPSAAPLSTTSTSTSASTAEGSVAVSPDTALSSIASASVAAFTATTVTQTFSQLSYYTSGNSSGQPAATVNVTYTQTFPATVTVVDTVFTSLQGASSPFYFVSFTTETISYQSGSTTGPTPASVSSPSSAAASGAALPSRTSTVLATPTLPPAAATNTKPSSTVAVGAPTMTPGSQAGDGNPPAPSGAASDAPAPPTSINHVALGVGLGVGIPTAIAIVLSIWLTVITWKVQHQKLDETKEVPRWAGSGEHLIVHNDIC